MTNTAADRIAARRGRTVPQRGFIGLAAFAFLASAAGTVAWCSSMAGMGRMAMPGGWSMSMTWMPMPGRSWSAAVAFLAMWIIMMAAMMLPSLVPMLWRYRLALGRAPGLGWLTALVAAGYFLVWGLIGAALYPPGVALAAAAMREPDLARAAPVLAALCVLAAGAFQFTGWKVRALACCREMPDPAMALPPRSGAALGCGIRLALHCAGCCGNLMALLVVAGLMDIAAMAAVTLAISAERLAPGGKHLAHGLGVALIGTGLVLAARAAGLF